MTPVAARTLVAAAACAITLHAWAGLTMQRSDGGAMELNTEPPINRGSTMRRERFVLNDLDGPALLGPEAGLDPLTPDRNRGARIQFNGTLAASTPLHAVEIRCAAMDVFGDLLGTVRILRQFDIVGQRDLQANFHDPESRWATHMLRSACWVHRALLANGTVYRVPADDALHLLRQLAPGVENDALTKNAPAIEL